MIPHIRKILYATDHTKNAAYAFFYAVDMARKHDATIIALHAVEPGRSISYAGAGVEGMLKGARKQEQEKELKAARKRCEEVCRRYSAYTGSSCIELVSKILVPIGHPVEEILEAASAEGCDVIVLGTHGKGFLKQTFLGSVAAKVLERSRKPVFIIPLPPDKADMDWDRL